MSLFYLQSSGGSRISHWGGGGADVRRWRFSIKMYMKTKELVPWGGGHAPDTPSRSASEKIIIIFLYFLMEYNKKRNKKNGKGSKGIRKIKGFLKERDQEKRIKNIL